MARGCPECGRELSGDENFCPGCGHDLASEPECPECGFELNGDERYCPGCGNDLDEQRASRPPPGDADGRPSSEATSTHPPPSGARRWGRSLIGAVVVVAVLGIVGVQFFAPAWMLCSVPGAECPFQVQQLTADQRLTVSGTAAEPVTITVVFEGEVVYTASDIPLHDGRYHHSIETVTGGWEPNSLYRVVVVRERGDNWEREIVTPASWGSDLADASPTQSATAQSATPPSHPEAEYRVVTLRNEQTARAVQIRITHAGETLHNETYRLDAGEQRVVYNSSTDNLGAAKLGIRVSTDSDNRSIVFRGCTNELPIVIDADGTINPRLAVC